MADRIQFRRDIESNWSIYNPILLEGEIGIVLNDPNKYKIGDGIRPWNQLPLRGFNGTLVDNLTSGGRNAALSAEQGKILRETTPEVSETTDDLNIKDPQGYVLAKFRGGHVKTKNFDSAKARTTDDPLSYSVDSSFADLSLEDEERNAIVEFKNGHVKTKNFDSERIIHEVDSPADLEFEDENGNIVMRVNNGHIKTKNFDSSKIDSDIPEYFKVSRFKGKRLAIIGDSISTFSGTMPSGYAIYYPRGDVQSVTQLWWYKVCKKLEMEYTNTAWSGSRVTGAPKGTTAAAGCSDVRINDAGRLGAPDIIICYISCNDWAGNVGIGTWQTADPIVDDSAYTPSQTVSTLREAYSLMLYKLVKKYPAARIFVCTNLDDTARDQNTGYPSNNGAGISTYEWNKNVKEVAEALGARVIDLHACGLNYMNIASYCVDSGLHPNAAGQQIMADFITAQLIANY